MGRKGGKLHCKEMREVGPPGLSAKLHSLDMNQIQTFSLQHNNSSSQEKKNYIQNTLKGVWQKGVKK